MYSSGKRDLPLPAMVLLGEMLAYVKSAEESRKNKPAPEEQKETQVYLERRLLDNNYKQLQLERTIAAAERKQLAQPRRSLVSEFLEMRKAAKQVVKAQEVLLIKPAKIAQKNGSVWLAEQQHQKELLELERNMLESKLVALRKSGGA